LDNSREPYLVALEARLGTIPGVEQPERDYYDVLGIPRDADGAEIKKAFHTLIREWHPDVAGPTDAEGRFRELAEAYSVLSTPETRRLYDEHGQRGSGDDTLVQIPWDEQLADATRGANVDLDLKLREFEAQRGSRPTVTVQVQVLCPVCLGTGRASGNRGRSCERCGGARVVEAERRLRVQTPPGLEDGAQLRVAGEGNQGGADAIPGDLLIHVHVLPSPNDRPMVRYASLALLLIAIAVLAVYVLH
jgi:curved DNA-binding protein